MNNNARLNLEKLSNELNRIYGFVKIEGENYGEPSINSGPCGPFAKVFYQHWNERFKKKVNIVFVMVKDTDECWHVLIRLPNGQLYDGGIGIHSEEKYGHEFNIEDMVEFDLDLLEERSYGLEREYPRYCPNFSIDTVTSLVKKYLGKVENNDI